MSGSAKKRVCLSQDELANLSREELLERWKEQESYIDIIESRGDSSNLPGAKENGDKKKQDSGRRENALLMRLAAKEQIIQDSLNQIQELKQAQTASSAQLRNMLLDPAVNIMFQRMKKEIEDLKQKLEQTQNDLSAWKFTPDSHTGKRLMGKCRLLLTENEELGKQVSSGRIAKLEGEIALKKTLVHELKKSQAETDEFLLELDEDVEGMQSTIFILQQQLKESREELTQLRSENQKMHAELQTLNRNHHKPMSSARTERDLSPPPLDSYKQEPPEHSAMEVDVDGADERSLDNYPNLSSPGRTSLVLNDKNPNDDLNTSSDSNKIESMRVDSPEPMTCSSDLNNRTHLKNNNSGTQSSGDENQILSPENNFNSSPDHRTVKDENDLDLDLSVGSNSNACIPNGTRESPALVAVDDC